jgi:hypothetical protein
MLTTLVAILCQVASNACVEEIITDQASLQSCQIQGQIGIAEWMSRSPAYRTGWNLERYKCVVGPYTKARAS